MRYQDIEFQASYLLKNNRHRAVVVGPAVRGRLNGRYKFPVRFPEAKPGGRLYDTEITVEAADFKRLWLQEDQLRFEAAQRTSAEIDAMEGGLIAAGFPPNSIRQIHEGDIWLTFSGDVSKRVFEVLIRFAAQKGEQPSLESNYGEQISDRFD